MNKLLLKWATNWAKLSFGFKSLLISSLVGGSWMVPGLLKRR